MKAVILAGGLGTRLSEETYNLPKPMVTVGGKPILWHIMKMYSYYGVNDFIICCGYKGYLIKEYFANYYLHMSDITFDMKNNSVKVHQERAEPWQVTLVDTGEDVMTGGRLKRIASFLKDEDIFCLTYGDGVSDLNITASIEYHKSHGKLATLTAVYPPGRFGALEIEGKTVTKFKEKPKGDGGLVNGGFFVLSPKILSIPENDESVWEKEPLAKLASDRELMAYEHDGFFQSMDTLRDKNYLEELWVNDKAPWKKWL